jgi:hypothetical protein
MLGYEVMRSLTNSQGMAPFPGLWDLSRPWESLDRARGEKSDIGWTTSIGRGGEVLVIPIDRLENLLWDLVWVSRLGFCPSTGIQSRVVSGLLTGHNTQRRHLHLLGLSDSPLCRRRETENETAAHILCECEALASHRHAYLGSSFSEPENIQRISLGAIWNFSRVTGFP